MSAVAVEPRRAAPRVPAELLDLAQWCLWGFDNGRKRPMALGGYWGSSTNPATWGEYGEAVEALQRVAKAEGIGFVFTEADPYTGIDLDDCLDDAGRLKDWAVPILQRFAGTYAEVSPSGSGIKMWCQGTIAAADKFAYQDGAIEIYSTARFFTVTGNIWHGALLEVADCQESIDWLLTLNPAGAKKPPFMMPETIKYKTQHHTLFSAGRSMRAKGFSQSAIEAALLEESKRCEKIPPPANVAKIAKDVCKKPAGPSPEFNRQVARTVEWATNKDEEQPDNEEYVDWKRRLHRKEPTLKQSVEGKPGKPLLNHLNVMVALQYAPEWKDVFVFNELKQKAQAVKPPPIGGKVPRDWTDADDTETVVWFQRNGIQIVSREMVGSCVQAWAKRHSINPLRQWLESLQWDGEPRVDGWLSTYFGVSPSSYAVSVGRYWLISGVARVLKPGPVQADHMLVLEGDQGIGKSTGLRALAGDEYFTDSMPDISSKDAQIHALNYWVIEMSELSALGKAEVEAVKSFIGKQMETFRRPYGHHEETVRRYCIFAGTTNRSDYLKDETGNRRFWPVKCTHADVARIAADREQLWAEAVVLYRDGAKWWPENSKLLEAIEAEQAERMEGDPWQVEIERFVEAKDRVTAESVLIELGVEIPDMTQLHRRRVGKCLRECGFHPKYTRDMGRCFERRK